MLLLYYFMFSFTFTLGIFFSVLQCTQFVVYINRFCERYNRKYVSADHILRQKYVSFWQGERRKKWKNIKIPRFFHQKTNGDATRKSFQKLRRRTIYTTSAHSKDFMYGNIMCLKCQNRGYFDWRILNIYAQNVNTSLSNVNYNSKKWYFSIASS